jgi:hypothetical protein
LASSVKDALSKCEADQEEAMSDLDLFDTLLLEVDTARGELGQPAVARDLQDKLQQVRRLSQRLGIAPETAHGAAAGGDAGGMTNLSDEEEPLFQGQEHAGGAAGPPATPPRKATAAAAAAAAGGGGGSGGGGTWSSVKKIISSKDDHQRYKSIDIKKDAKDLADEEILKAVVAIHGRVRDR